jgi:hypothetical protein
MRQVVLAVATIITVATISPAARADMIGAAAGAGTGLLVAGPVGAVAGAVVGGFSASHFGGRQLVPARVGSTTISVATVLMTGIIKTDQQVSNPVATSATGRLAAGLSDI